jgi:hypothetical protein
MVEQYSPFQEFDPEAAGQALGAEPRTTQDVAYGDGQAFDLTEAVLEVFPEAGVTRATTPDARVEIFCVPRYTVREQRVIFELGDQENRSRLQVRADGKVAFHPVLRSPEPPQTNETAASGSQDSPAGHVASETTTAPSGTPANVEGKEHDVVTMQGRIGKVYRTVVDADPPTAKLSLGVKTREGQEASDWWKVLATGDLAVNLHNWRWRERPAKLETGWLTEVTGIPEITERTGRDGPPGQTGSLMQNRSHRSVRQKTGPLPGQVVVSPKTKTTESTAEKHTAGTPTTALTSPSAIGISNPVCNFSPQTSF